MMIFLDADRVISYLIGKNFIKPADWKKKIPDRSKYISILEHVQTGNKICFEIYIKHGIHMISSMYIHNLERIYQINLQIIFETCKI